MQLYSRSNRISDDAIYLTEDRRKKKKNIFIEVGDNINGGSWKNNSVLLAEGCAAREYINYLEPTSSKFCCVDLDVSSKLISGARVRNSKGKFIQIDVQSRGSVPNKLGNVVTMFGVVNFSDVPSLITYNFIN